MSDKDFSFHYNIDTQLGILKIGTKTVSLAVRSLQLSTVATPDTPAVVTGSWNCSNQHPGSRSSYHTSYRTSYRLSYPTSYHTSYRLSYPASCRTSYRLGSFSRVFSGSKSDCGTVEIIPGGYGLNLI